MQVLAMGFDAGTISIIKSALSLAKSQIQKYCQEKELLVDESHRGIIDVEKEGLLKNIEGFEKLIIDTTDRPFAMDADGYLGLLDTIKSALQTYLQDTIKAKDKTGLSSFDTRIAETRRVLSLESLKDRKDNLFDKYYAPSISEREGKKVEVFLSYSHNDRVLAGKVAEQMKEKGVDVFLAHESIEISEEWREEIAEHLANSALLIALLTPDFEKSVWTNQETGFMLGRGAKIIPLIVGETDIKDFGFVEALQGIHVNEENLQECIEKILRIILQ
jgi:hypothetical protein